MDKVITTVLLIVAGVICTIVVFNSVYPMINRSSEAMNSMSQSLNERMKSRISISHAANEEDRRTITVWVKNVGEQRIVEIEKCDLYFGPEGDISLIPHEDDADSSYPRWSYTITNDTQWVTSSTLQITIVYDPLEDPPPTGTYYMKLMIPSGVSDEYFFSM